MMHNADVSKSRWHTEAPPTDNVTWFGQSVLVQIPAFVFELVENMACAGGIAKGHIFFILPNGLQKTPAYESRTPGVPFIQTGWLKVLFNPGSPVITSHLTGASLQFIDGCLQGSPAQK